MEIPEKVAAIIGKLNQNGHEAYVVGGCVRDMLMGKAPKDWDITTSAEPSEVIALFAHVVETGIQHGTVTVVLGGENFEVTTYRIDGAYTDHRRPDEVAFTKNLAEDLRRRDFTMNAIAYHPREGFQDPYNGMADIDAKLIRGVGDPAARFQEDALRMLRAVRFACQLDFAIEEQTYEALKAHVALIESVSVERIRDELTKAFLGDYESHCLLLLQSGLLEAACPGLYRVVAGGLAADLESLGRCGKEAHKVFALLLRNIEPQVCGDLLQRLKFDNKTIKKIRTLTVHINAKVPEDPYEIRKLLFQIGEDAFFDLLSLQEALGRDIQKSRRVAEDIIKSGDPLALKSLAVNGDFLMNRFQCRGKAVGEVLQHLMDSVLQCPHLNTEEVLCHLAKSYLAGK